MAAIYLVRHGQASFGKADYDQLSDKGMAQSQLLGEHWQSLPTPQQCYVGGLLRHEQTREHFFNGCNLQSLSATTHNGFNEFDHEEVLVKHQPQWKNFACLNDYFLAQDDPKKSLHLAFNEAVKRWMSGDHDAEYRETWQQFTQRVIKALNDVIEQAKITKQTQEVSDIVVFTSGGPIAVILGHILSLKAEQGLMMNQQLVNSGVTKLLFSNDQVNVDYINNYTHLQVAGQEWITYR